MNILGISALDKESTATLLQDGHIVAAVSEERLTRVKQQGGFPRRAVEEVLRLSGLQSSEIACVAYPFFDVWKELQLSSAAAFDDVRRWPRKVQQRGMRRTLRHYGALASTLAFGVAKKLSLCDRELAQGLGELGLAGRLRRYDHQYCHAVSAYYTSTFDRALVASLDWYGSGKAGGIFLGDGGRLQLIDPIFFPNSLGVLYAGVTSALGFVPDRHEGKVVGLAAYGDPSRLAPDVLARFAERPRGYEFLDAMDAMGSRILARAHPREDVAAAHQEVLEQLVLRSVRAYLQAFHVSRVAVAGGIFANVKLNQKLALLPEVDELFVHPAMSDMGSGTGAALAAALEAGEVVCPVPIGSVFLGPEYSDDAIRAVLVRSGLRYEYTRELPRRIAEQLAAGKIVGRFTGRMEYGPRALGNRSILASAADVAITEVLNRKLERSEFMPFAPATLEEAAGRCYVGSDKVAQAARFMTVCLPCVNAMRDQSPAAVHVDGTARPQLVSSRSNADLYEILTHVERLTGAASVLNTSFNIHEEPIVCSPEDAIQVYTAAELDALAIGNFLVSR